MRKVSVLLFLGLAAALVASACGGDEATPTAAPTATPTRAPATSPTATGVTGTPAASPTVAPASTATPRPTAAPTAAPSPAASPTASPKVGGTLKLAGLQQTAPFSAFPTALGATANATDPMFNRIVVADPDDNSKMIGDLAEKWQVSDGGKTYTFNLRSGVRWHDGVIVTAEEVKGAFEILAGTTNSDPYKRSLFTDFESVQAPDPATLVIKTKQPTGSLPARLNQYMIVPKHILDAGGEFDKNFTGTGPFKLSKLTQDAQLEMVRNPDYFTKGLPYLDGVTVFFMGDEGLRISSIRTGRVDAFTITGFVGQNSAAPLKSVQGIVLDTRQGDALLSFLFQTDKAPWNDVRARRAVSLAFDRQKAIELAGQGLGTPRVMPLFGEFSLPDSEIAKLPGFRQPKDADIAEAKRLMAEVNPSKSVTIGITTIKGRFAQETLAVLGVELLTSLGLQAQVVPVETAKFTETQRNGGYEIQAVAGRNIVIIDPDGIGAQFQPAGGTALNWKTSARALELFQAQASTADASRRVQLMRDLQKYWTEEWPSVPGYMEFYVIPRWDYVKNVKQGVGQYNNSRYDQVWIDK